MFVTPTNLVLQIKVEYAQNKHEDAIEFVDFVFRNFERAASEVQAIPDVRAPARIYCPVASNFQFRTDSISTCLQCQNV